MRFLLIPLLFLAACSTPIEMVAPNGRIVSCGPFSMTGGGEAASRREAQCIQDYKEQGYVRR